MVEFVAPFHGANGDAIAITRVFSSQTPEACSGGGATPRPASPDFPFELRNATKIMNTLQQPRPGGASVSRMVDFVQPSLKLKSILVPIDFSKSCQQAFAYALPLARQFGGEITLLHAIEPPRYAMDLSYIPMSEGFPTASMKKELEELGRRMMEPKLLKDVVVQVGTAFEVITNTARDCEIDLIVLTTHGKTGLKHVFMGSTAERVVRHAPCPVLVVRKCEHEFS
jgi:universal stress protein A